MSETPILEIVQGLLVERGWKLRPTFGEMIPLYEDPEGNRYVDIFAALQAQFYREIAADLREEFFPTSE